MLPILRLRTIDDSISLKLLVGKSGLSIGHERMLQRSILSYVRLIQPTSNIGKPKMTCFKRIRSKTAHHGLRKITFISQ